MRETIPKPYDGGFKVLYSHFPHITPLHWQRIFKKSGNLGALLLYREYTILLYMYLTLVPKLVITKVSYIKYYIYYIL